MSDVFISYDSADKERVRPLVQVLEGQGWTVWWDRRIPPGKKFADVIHEAIESAKCILVVWTTASVASKWVRKEAAEGDRRDVLVPVLYDEVTIPFEFRDIHAAGLVGYPAVSNHTELHELLRAIGSVIGKPVSKTAEGVRRPPQHKTPGLVLAERAVGVPLRVVEQPQRAPTPALKKNERIALVTASVLLLFSVPTNVLLDWIVLNTWGVIPGGSVLVALFWPTRFFHMFIGVVALHGLNLAAYAMTPPFRSEDASIVAVTAIVNASIAAAICWWRLRALGLGHGPRSTSSA